MGESVNSSSGNPRSEIWCKIRWVVCGLAKLGQQLLHVWRHVIALAFEKEGLS
jgi:hypothetical protein